MGDSPRVLEHAVPRWASAWSGYARWDPRTPGYSRRARHLATLYYREIAAGEPDSELALSGLAGGDLEGFGFCS